MLNGMNYIGLNVIIYIKPFKEDRLLKNEVKYLKIFYFWFLEHYAVNNILYF